MNSSQILNNKIVLYLRQKLIYQIIAGAINSVAVLLIIWVSTFLADYIFYFSVPVRWFVLIANCILTVYLLYLLLLRFIIQAWQLKKSHDFTVLTKEIGPAFPDINDKLTNIFQLSQENSENDSPELRKLALDRFIQKIAHLDFRSILHLKLFLLPVSIILFVVTGSLILISLTSDAMSNSALRIFDPLGSYELLPEYSFFVSPGDTTILSGNTIKITSRYYGPHPEGLMLEYKEQSSEYFKETDLKKSGNQYTGEILNIRENLEYFIRAVPEKYGQWQDKLNSQIFKVDVRIPPAVTELQLRVIPPAYTRLPEQISEKNLGNIVAYTGSEINLSAWASKKVASAAVIFSDEKKYPMQMRENKLTSRFTISESGKYYIHLSDEQNIANQNPIEYQITALSDRFPTIEVIDPGADIEIPPDAAINMQIEANDDFGFSQLLLNFQIISAVESLGDSTWKKVPVKINDPVTKYLQQTYLWNFRTMNIGYGDAIKYYFSVADNDRISGPKWSKSGVFQIRFPTLDQIFSEFDERQEENLDKAEEISTESKELKEKLEEIQRELKREKTIDWEKEKEIESAIEKQKELEKKLDEIDKALEEAIRKIEQSELISPEILKKYSQLQELFQELISPELSKSLEELRESLEKLDKKEVDNSLNNFKLNQEEFIQNLERTLELFKKVKLEQELDRLVQLSREMLEKQEKMTTNLGKEQEEFKSDQNNYERQAEQQKESLQQIENTLSDLNKEKTLNEYPETNELLKKSEEFIRQEELAYALEQLQKNIAQSNQSAAQQKSGKISQKIKQLHTDLAEAQQKMKTLASDKIMSMMQRATDNMLALSKEEEELFRETKSASNLSDKMRDLAAQQQNIAENAGRVFQEIIQLSHETFALPPELSKSMGKANYGMRKSISELEERNQQSAGTAQIDAMSGLNEAIASMQTAMDEMASSDSPFGMENFMKQLQNLASAQGKVNEQSLNFVPGEGGQPQQIPGNNERLKRLAAEQRAVQEAFEKMHEEYGDSKSLGRLGDIGEEMKEVVKDLESLKVNRKTIERQQQILTRMLDAQRSVREKEYSRERKAETGKEYARKSPELNQESMDEKLKQLQIDLLKALQEGYNPDYEKLIEEYFKSLNQEYLKE